MASSEHKQRTAGQLNRRIALEAPVRVNNGSGGVAKTWEAMVPGEVWAEMIPLRGGEALTHNLTTDRQLWRVVIRYRSDLNTDCRIIYQGKDMNIRSCEDPDGRRQWLVMTCETGART